MRKEILFSLALSVFCPSSLVNRIDEKYFLLFFFLFLAVVIKKKVDGIFVLE